MDVLNNLFAQRFHSPVLRVQPLQGQLGGSGRKIIRLCGEKLTAVGVLHDVRAENVAFLEFSRHFRRHGLPVAEIYAEDLSHGAYLVEDLGDTTLFEFLSANRQGESIAPTVIEAYRKAVALLPRFQVEAGRDLNYKVCYPRSSFDRQSIAWDLNYFKYYFLRLAGVPFNEQELEDDFGRLTKFLLTAQRDYFLYRDFQSRNIMLRNVTPATASLPFSMTPRPICRPSCAGNCSIIILARWATTSSLTVKLSCSITTPTFMSASCRPWARMASADSTSASRCFCRVCPMR